ncbi:protein jag [Alicyclobacillaceae bacterium I2511]|nr:protein jag [Alicyclobacillaceae bacterium I2511]
MKKVQASGRTVEEALTSALVRLGVTRSQASVRVLQEPVKGFLGFIGGREAKIEVSVAASPETVAQEFLVETLRLMGLVDARVHRTHLDTEDKSILLDVECKDENFSTVIGRHGVTLDALQFLAGVVASRDTEGFVKVYLDAGGYRQRRTEGLQRLAERVAEKVVRTGQAVPLEAMSAADRRIVHMFLQEYEGVATVSEGVEPHRMVVVVRQGVGERLRVGKPRT